MNPRHQAIELFSESYGGEPEFLVRSPGRVNLIGEHTDYNDGFVLPMAIEQSMWAAVRPRPDRSVHLASAGHPDASFSLDSFVRDDGWAEYVKGMASALGPADLTGWDGAFATDIPIGAGLSSSAALEIVSSLAFCAVSNRPWDAIEAALAGQTVENEWMGVGSGIMDQLIVATARAGNATLIDCRSLESGLTPVPGDLGVVILDTGTRRRLIDSSYDDRARACGRAASAAGVVSLRDLSVDDLDALSGLLDDTTYRRARHVITEIDRTLAAAQALEDRDLDRFGDLIRSSHASLRDDFDVSSPALDAMVKIASGTPGCVGARMTGAGFGGCAVAFVHEVDPVAFADIVTDRYRQLGHAEPFAYQTAPAPGAGIEAR